MNNVIDLAARRGELSMTYDECAIHLPAGDEADWAIALAFLFEEEYQTTFSITHEPPPADDDGTIGELPPGSFAVAYLMKDGTRFTHGPLKAPTRDQVNQWVLASEFRLLDVWQVYVHLDVDG